MILLVKEEDNMNRLIKNLIVFVILILCLNVFLIPVEVGMAQSDYSPDDLRTTARSLFVSYDWDKLAGLIGTIIHETQSGNDVPQAAQAILDRVGLGGLGQLAALAGRSLGGEQIPPMEIAEAAKQVLRDMGQGGLGELAEQAGWTLGGGATDWMAVADAAKQVLSDMGLGGLGQLAELAGRSLGGEQIDWMDLEGAARQTMEDLGLGWLGDAVAEWSEAMGRWWSQFDFGSWGSIWGSVSGGICPTFIQPDFGLSCSRPVPMKFDRELFGAIVIPSNNCLLRSDIPIYGVAGGSNFERYQVEYGVGIEPTEWHLIGESTTPQNQFNLSQVPDLLQGDLDLRGNLATWNTGLKNWEHLPWHPASDTTDLNGVYTIRLTVYGHDGKTVEDRVIGEVGRVIAQCLPGIAISADKKVIMHFPEQSLMAPFRVYSIRPVTSEALTLPTNQKLIGEVYQIREGGDRFIKPITLEMSYDSNVVSRGDLSGLGIFTYDTKQKSWVLLNTRQAAEQMVLRTNLNELPAPKAYFAILLNSKGLVQSVEEESIYAQGHESQTCSPRKPFSDKIFVKDTFEADLGEWSGRDAEAGASVIRDCDEGENGNCYVRVTNKNFGGNFSCNVVTTPFDVSQYPLISFDYRVKDGTKVDFYVRVAGRWYDIGFTDDRNEYRNKDVNIAYLGQIRGITPDDNWHHADFNLCNLLRQRTRNTLVESIILADWNVGGYMKLEFGSNMQDATVHFDNFTIARDTVLQKSLVALGDSIMVEDFERNEAFNRLEGLRMVFSNPGTNNCSAQLVERKSKGIKQSNGRCLLIQYDVLLPGDYCGWWTSLEGVNIKDCTDLNFEIYTPDSLPACLIGLKDLRGQEVKVPLRPYLGESQSDGWRLAVIPMVVFSGLIDLASMDNFSISFEEKDSSGRGFVQVDNIQFHNQGRYDLALLIDDFEDSIRQLNALGHSEWTFASGAAAIRAERQSESGLTKKGTCIRISYGGSIGLDLGKAGFSYAGWATGLGGIDISSFDSLRFAIRGQNGGEDFNIYLDDGNKRWPVVFPEYGTAYKTWNLVSIPLKDYLVHGVDLSHIEELQFVFEWSEKSGTIWIDDISLVPATNVPPTIMTNLGGVR
jgi:hypothetical protein